MGRSPPRKRGPDMQGRSPQANLPEGNSLLPAMGLRKRVAPRSPVRKNCTPGSVRGASGNWRPYRDVRQAKLGVSCGVEVPTGEGLANHPYRVLHLERRGVSPEQTR